VSSRIVKGNVVLEGEVGGVVFDNLEGDAFLI
jgi:hypothetical protein